MGDPNWLWLWRWSVWDIMALASLTPFKAKHVMWHLFAWHTCPIGCTFRLTPNTKDIPWPWSFREVLRLFGKLSPLLNNAGPPMACDPKWGENCKNQ